MRCPCSIWAAAEEELAPPPGGGPVGPSQPSLQDVHLCQLREENGSDWKLACDVSPRTAKLRGHFHDAVGMGPCTDSDEAEPHEAGEGEIRCPSCKMRFNGPTQYDDHLIGKRHRKFTTNLRGRGRHVAPEGDKGALKS